MPKTNQIPFLTPSRRSPGATYHWKPSPKLRRLGWTNQCLGKDWDAACTAAMTQNRTLKTWLEANAGGIAPKKPPRILRWKDLVADYKAGDAYTGLKPKSRREYDCHLRTLDHWALDGQLRLADLDRPMIVDFRNTLVRDHRRHRTAAILRVLSIVIGHGVNRGWLPLGLAAKMKIPNPPKRRHRILIDHLPQLLAAADTLAMPHVRLGIVLGFFTTQREGDLLATTSFRFRDVGDISGEARRALAGKDGRVLGLFLEQEKTDALVGIPLLPVARTEVEAAIAASRAAGVNYAQLIVKGGRPCHQKTFQRDFATVRDFAAKAAQDALQALLTGGAGEQAIHDARTLFEALAGLQFRDLRRSGMCWLREMGVPVAMIASISGHSIDETQKILDTYMPRDTRSAAEGMAIAVVRQAAREAADAKEREAL